jgi:hypothetical protein
MQKILHAVTVEAITGLSVTTTAMTSWATAIKALERAIWQAIEH